MLARLLVTFSVCIYAAVIPFLEINASHVFNPLWPPHARLHEVWQLITNCAIGGLCLWWLWIKKHVATPALLSTIIMASVLLAHLLEPTYGGSLASGNISKTLLGLEYAAVAAGLAVVAALTGFALAKVSGGNSIHSTQYSNTD